MGYEYAKLGQNFEFIQLYQVPNLKHYTHNWLANLTELQIVEMLEWVYCTLNIVLYQHNNATRKSLDKRIDQFLD